MAEDSIITATRVDIDDVVFSAMTEVAGTLTGMSVREKTKFAIAAADRVMLGIDDLGGASKRSEAAKRAAAARYSKPAAPKPTPGPAVPAPQVPAPAAMPTFTAAPAVPPLPPAPDPTQAAVAAGVLPPPPHPALAPGQTPFGAPPP
jgi:hypothetical protein